VSGAVGDYYEVDGEKLVRVSRILDQLAKPNLQRWRERIGPAEANRVAREAAELGSRVHAACEAIALAASTGVAPPCLDADLLPFAETYAEWLEREVQEVVAIEVTTYSKLHRYAGTADLVAILKGDEYPSLIDLKTSNSLPHIYRAQTAAYVLALREHLGLHCPRRLVVNLPSKKPGKLILREYEDLQRDTEAFLAMLMLYHWQTDRQGEWKT
jgi:hypothetical protein